jgi:hypothetical protein
MIKPAEDDGMADWAEALFEQKLRRRQQMLLECAVRRRSPAPFARKVTHPSANSRLGYSRSALGGAWH